MVISKEAKKEILIESFDVLKENINDNTSELQNIITKIAPLDKDMAIEMWIYILQQYQNIHEYSNETYYLTSSTVLGLSREIGISNIARIMLNNPFLRRKIYNESAQPDREVIAYFIDSKDLKNANEFLNDVYNNPNHSVRNKEDAFGEYLDYLIKLECKNISEESAEFLLSWVDKVKTKEAKVKAKLSLLDYM